jgi:hypothetical protein
MLLYAIRLAALVAAALTTMSLAAKEPAGPAGTARVDRPQFDFPVHVEGKHLVDRSGRHWPAFGRSQFALAWHGYHGRWDRVDMLLDRDRDEGFTYVRVFGMLSWLDPVWEPWTDPDRYWRACEETARRAASRNIVVWFTVFADWNRLPGVSEERFRDMAKRSAAFAISNPNVLLEVVNEYYVNGFSVDRVREGGRLMRDAGYQGVLAGSAGYHPTVDRARNSPDEDLRAFAGGPFDLVTIHTHRTHGHHGWQHVKEVRDSIESAASLGLPLVIGEPIGFDFKPDPGRYDNSPTRALASMLAAWVSGAAGYCYHADGGLWSHPERYPGEELMHLFWELDAPRGEGWEFVNGHWPDAPVTSRSGFSGDPGFRHGPYRIYGATSRDGRYFAVAFGAVLPWMLEARRPIALVRHDAAGIRVDDHPLPLEAGNILFEDRHQLLILSGSLVR